MLIADVPTEVAITPPDHAHNRFRIIDGGGMGVNANVGMDAIVDAGWVADHAGDPDVRLVEVDVSPATYNQGHIPGAVLWNAYADLRDAGYRPIPRADFERVLSRSGISPETTVVFYGYGAFLGFWLMKAYGHRDARVLDGNRDGWEKQGREWTSAVAAPPETTYGLPVEDTDLLASRQEVESAIASPASVVLDVRSGAEYGGERFWPSGATADTGRAGHIPGAISLPIDLVRDDAGAIKATDDLRRLYEGAGISPDQRVIAYCTIGNRASLAWFILKYQLGYPNVAVYQGSYVEWGKLPDTLIETG
jgi:thiosulfate/3-mercaptopyruvate sulfurtransferase